MFAPDHSSSSAASASYVAHSADLAALQTLEIEKLIHEGGRYGDDQNDFQQRTVVSQYSFPEGEQSIPRSITGPGLDTSLMASMPASRRGKIGSDTESSSLPSLDPSSSTVHGIASARTSRADSVLEPPPSEPDEGGVPERPTIRLECPLAFLNCQGTFDDLEEWDTHHQCHFKGRLPKTIRCPFRCDWSVMETSGAKAWSTQRQHIDEEHAEGGEVDTSRWPSEQLVKSLLIAGAINVPQQKELMHAGRLVGEPFLQTSGHGREQRERRRTTR